MKVYEIINGEEKQVIGCLIYFEREKSDIIELKDNLDEWTAPLLFAQTVKAGTYTIGRELSRLWVSERVIPAGRQNIDSILANAKMTSYDEMQLLEKSAGRCSQDSLYIKKLETIPEYVRLRVKRTLKECVPCDGYSLLCFFNDGTTRKVSLLEYLDKPEIKKIVSNEEVFKSVHIAAGGYCVTFNDSIDISAIDLYAKGINIPLPLGDFISFVDYNIVDASGVCYVLECSRQNLTQYISKNILKPIKKDLRGNIYTKGNTYRTEVEEMIS